MAIQLPSSFEEQWKKIQETFSKAKAGVSELTSQKLENETGQDIDVSNVPILDTGANGAGQNFAAVTASQEELKAQIAKLQTQTYTPTEETKGYLQKVKDLITKRETTPVADTQKLLTDILTQWGLTPEKFKQQEGLISQIATINAQIANVDARVAKQIESLPETSGYMAGMFQITGHQAAIQRQAAIEKSGLSAQANALAAQANALQGQFTQAQSIAGQVVDAATYQEKQNLADMDWAIGAYSDLFSAMDKEERDSWQTTYHQATDALKTKSDEVQKTIDLVIDAAGRGIQIPYNPSTDTYESILKKYSASVATTEAGKAGIKTTENLATEIVAIPRYGSRENALTALNNNKTALIMLYGQDGYNKLVAEVDRLFPAPAPKVNQPPVSPKMAKAGGIIRQKVGGMVEFPIAEIKKAGGAISSFFTGLFGR